MTCSNRRIFSASMWFFKERLISLGCPAEKIITHHSAIETKNLPLKNVPSNLINVWISSQLHVSLPKRPWIYDSGSCSFKADLSAYQMHRHWRSATKSPRIQKVPQSFGQRARYWRKCHFYGWAKTEDIIKELNTSDIFVLPSVTAQDGDQEGIPNALKEAMAVGLPVIATDHAGNSELIDHMQSGILVEEKCWSNYKCYWMDTWKSNIG